MNLLRNRHGFTLVFLVLASLLALIFHDRLQVEDHLLPLSSSPVLWRSTTLSDVSQGGDSSIVMTDNELFFDIDVKLGRKIKYSYAGITLTFDRKNESGSLWDWSTYSSLLLNIKCTPNFKLNVIVHTFAPKVTNPQDFSSYKQSSEVIACPQYWNSVQINLKTLGTSEWWLSNYGQPLTEKHYDLDKVHAISITNAYDSPLDTQTKILISDIKLRQKPWQLTLFLVALWVIYAAIVIYHWRKKMPVLKPVLITNAIYEPVQVDSKREREKQALLSFLATGYCDPALELDTLVSVLGMNRTKINELLREETGLTFSLYVNQLRLTEAARLIKETKMGVAEAAYKVGFSNVSYFNRVFKKQFGTTPSVYQKSNS